MRLKTRHKTAQITGKRRRKAGLRRKPDHPDKSRQSCKAENRKPVHRIHRAALKRRQAKGREYGQGGQKQQKQPVGLGFLRPVSARWRQNNRQWQRNMRRAAQPRPAIPGPRGQGPGWPGEQRQIFKGIDERAGGKSVEALHAAGAPGAQIMVCVFWKSRPGREEPKEHHAERNRNPKPERKCWAKYSRKQHPQKAASQQRNSKRRTGSKREQPQCAPPPERALYWTVEAAHPSVEPH